MTAFLFAAALMSAAMSGGLALGAQAAVVVAPRVRAQHFADVLHALAAQRMSRAGSLARVAVLVLVMATVAGVIV